jgi:hypothetical protein
MKAAAPQTDAPGVTPPDPGTVVEFDAEWLDVIERCVGALEPRDDRSADETGTSGYGDPQLAQSSLGGATGRGSNTTRILVILPPSTRLQLAVASGSLPGVWRANQVSTSDPSTNIFSTTMSSITDFAIASSP